MEVLPNPAVSVPHIAKEPLSDLDWIFNLEMVDQIIPLFITRQLFWTRVWNRRCLLHYVISPQTVQIEIQI